MKKILFPFSLLIVAALTGCQTAPDAGKCACKCAAEKNLPPVPPAPPEKTVPPELPAVAWSNDAQAKTPLDTMEFRGPFYAEPVTLTLRQLPEHAWVKMRFNLLIVGTWDGSSPVWGPDLWALQVRNGAQLIFASLCNSPVDYANNNHQSYPDDYPTATYKRWTGSSRHNTLNFPNPFPAPGEPVLSDAVYPVEIVFPHTGDSLVLDFSGIYSDPPSEKQIWGIANFEYETVKELPEPSNARLQVLWEKLADKDPVVANAARWQLVAGGNKTIAFIEARVAEMQKEFEENSGRKPVLARKYGMLLHRANRVLLIIDGAGTAGTRFATERLYPEYFDIPTSYSSGARER